MPSLLFDAMHIMHANLKADRIRETYWDVSDILRTRRLLRDGKVRTFRMLAEQNWRQYAFGGTAPASVDPQNRMAMAVEWLLRGQAATPDDGVSLGYFPYRHGETGGAAGWLPSYPETTGYIITSLLAYASRFDASEVRTKALRMADWEVAIQMPSGAVQGGPVTSPDKQTPAAFNTGMVLDGWCSAYEASKQEAYLAAARRAGDFLVADLDPDGYFRTNGAFVKSGEIKTYTCLCAWAMYRLGNITGENRYRDAAVRSAEAAVRQQCASGWFDHNCLSHSDMPLTHTIGYALQGILEVGVLAKRDDLIAAARRGLDAVLACRRNDGFLRGRFDRNWRPTVFSSCLTGSAQIAVVAYRMYLLTGDLNYRVGADSLVDFLKGLQLLDAEDANVNGALAGSFPLLGSYMRAGYPNWATKYFLDALMLQVATHAGPARA
jgi:hypothetical protein